MEQKSIFKQFRTFFSSPSSLLCTLPWRFPESHVSRVIGHWGQIHWWVGVHFVELCAYIKDIRGQNKNEVKHFLKHLKQKSNLETHDEGLPMKPLAGLLDRTESSLDTVLRVCFLTSRTVVGLGFSTLPKSSISFSWCRRSYSCLVKSPLRWGVPSDDGVLNAGGLPELLDLSSPLLPQPSISIHWGLLKEQSSALLKTVSLFQIVN